MKSGNTDKTDLLMDVCDIFSCGSEKAASALRGRLTVDRWTAPA